MTGPVGLNFPNYCCVPSPPPTVTDFLRFIQNVMGISATYLPATAPIITWVFNTALEIVNRDIGVVPTIPGTWSLYQQAVYNLAGSLLLQYAPDAFYEIGALTWANGLVTVTTTLPNGIMVGDQVVISGVQPNGYNGLTNVNSLINTTQFTYPLAVNYGPATVQQTIPNPVYTERVTEDEQIRLTEDDENRIILPVDYVPYVTVNAQVTEQFFLNARRNYNITAFAPGFVQSAADVSTSVGMVVPNFFKNLTLSDMQLMKDPYGRAYLSIAQKYGPNIWGIT